MYKTTLTTFIGAAALTLLSAVASAAPLSQANKAVDASAANLVQKVHTCHQHVSRDEKGWHYHRDYGCRRVWADGPRRHYYDPPRRVYRDYEYRRAPVCKRVCHYVGPVKVCEDKCW